MSEKEEYVSLEKALKELRLKEEELKRLVSEGEIRAFRDADKMKFRREDIEKLKQDTGKTIQYQDESSDTLTDDLLFDEGSDDLDLGKDIGMATAPISSDETFVDEPKKPAAKKTTAAPVKGAKTEVQRATGKTSSMRSGAMASKPAAAASAAAQPGGRTTSIRASAAAAAKVVRPREEMHPALVGVTIITTLVLIFSLAVWRDIADGSMSSITSGFAETANNWFGK